MPEVPSFLNVSWSDIDELALSLAERIVASGYRPDAIVGIMRGGWIPARILSDLLGVEILDAIEVKFYKGIGETREKPVVTRPPLADLRDKAVLLVDDVSDTGKSLSVAVSALVLLGPSRIKTATLYVKPWTMSVPDYYAATTESWIIFPWEKGEILGEVAAYASKLGEDPLEFIVGRLGFSRNYVERISRVRGIKLIDRKS